MEDHVVDYQRMRDSIFWLKLVLGAVSGTASYFILRFYIYLTFFVFIPALYALTLLITLFYIHLKRAGEEPFEVKRDLRMSLHFTGTWMMVFLVFGTACYYFGW